MRTCSTALSLSKGTFELFKTGLISSAGSAGAGLAMHAPELRQPQRNLGDTTLG